MALMEKLDAYPWDSNTINQAFIQENFPARPDLV